MTIYITGLGAVSAAGVGIPKTLVSFETGQRHLGPLTLFQSPVQAPVFEVSGLNGADGLWRNEQFEGRTLMLAFNAVTEAMANAGLLKEQYGLRVGVCLGTTVASHLNDLEFYRAFRNTGSAPMAPVDRYLNGNLAQAVANRCQFTGPAVCVVNACSSGADAVGLAASWINSGVCDIAIAGGAEELNRIPYAGFNSLSILSGEPCRPFDLNRSGLNLGEGAGVLVLESENAIKKED